MQNVTYSSRPSMPNPSRDQFPSDRSMYTTTSSPRMAQAQASLTPWVHTMKKAVMVSETRRETSMSVRRSDRSEKPTLVHSQLRAVC